MVLFFVNGIVFCGVQYIPLFTIITYWLLFCLKCKCFTNVKTLVFSKPLWAVFKNVLFFLSGQKGGCKEWPVSESPVPPSDYF